ncbi:ATP-binding protein [Pseudonocardia sp. HH130630-07]|uniref:ATP-binding protein n=1 Tax=Pseudonocardia sp. HH130630-07 TaxID=1690815 RepID=UPI0009F29AE5|nr:ATP-binding protein [Pseudonocardia sp. HH130630-07]
MSEPTIRVRGGGTAALGRALDSLAAGTSTVVTVTGEPGTGRSRLLHTAAAGARARGVRVLTARAVVAESEYPLGVVHGLLRPLDGSAELRRAPGAPADTALLHRWCRLVLDAAHRRPVLLVVDDLHWADTESQRWLQMLLRHRHGAPVGVLVAANGTHEAAEWAGAPAVRANVTLRTGPLPLAAVRAAVTAAYGAAPDRAFSVVARRATGGNPAVLAATLARLDRSVTPTSPAVPELRRCAALARAEQVRAVLDGIPADLVTALRAAAVCGPDLWPVVDRIGGPGPSTGADVRTRLAATGLVRGPGCLLLCDEVVTDVVLAGIDPDRRRGLFARAAALAVRAGLPDDGVARALLAAPTLGEPWGAELLYRVACGHRGRGNHAAAAACAERALLEPVPPGLSGPLMVELATARSWTEPVAARRMLALVVQEADPTDGPHGAQAADLLLADGDVGAARRALAITVRRCAGDTTAHRDLLSLSRLTDELGYDDLLAAPSCAPEPAGPGTDPPPAASTAAASGSLAWSEAVRGRDRAAATRLAREALAAPDAGWTPVMPRVMAAMTLEVAGCPHEALRALEPVLLDLAGDRSVPPAILAMTALVALRAGDLDGARRDLRAARAASAGRARPGGGDPLVAAVQILLHLAEGDLAEATVVASARHGVGGDRPGIALLAYALGRVHAARGGARAGFELFMRCGRLLLDRGRVNPALVPWRSAAAAALAACDEHAAALRIARDEHRLAVRWGAPGPIAVAGAAVAALGRELSHVAGP